MFWPFLSFFIKWIPIKIIPINRRNEIQYNFLSYFLRLSIGSYHPNIIKVIEFYEDDVYFYIVTELCTGGELFDRIMEESYLGEKEAAEIMNQILSAVLYCHSHDIVHRLI